jgi:hypothetical protein
LALLLCVTTACAAPPANESTEPAEPCTVEAPSSARAAAQNWCEGGVFTKVNVSNDANNFMVLLQLSNKGQRMWARNREATMERFGSITDEMVEKAQMNVAFSIHDTGGTMVGGCAQMRYQSASTCR